MSLGLDISKIARIESDRIYALILPEKEGDDTVTVSVQLLSSLLSTGEQLEALAPNYVKVALEKLKETAKIQKFRKKAVIPRESLALLAAAFRIAADTSEGRRP